jgi:hypothetical protein
VQCPQGERGRGEGFGASIERQTQLRFDSRQNGIEVVADEGICEAQDANAEVLDHGGSSRVVVREPFMLLAVEFDYEFRGRNRRHTGRTGPGAGTLRHESASRAVAPKDHLRPWLIAVAMSGRTGGARMACVGPLVSLICQPARSRRG